MVPVPLADEIYHQGDKVPPNSSSDNWKSEPYTVSRLIGHELDKKTSTVKFVVEWVNGKTTKEPEWILQEDIPTLVYEYWERKGGRANVTGFTSDHVFRIRSVVPTRRKKKYRVQWVGYPDSTDLMTWEDEPTLRRIAAFEWERFHSQPVKKRD
ncbi:hypothetical protein FANTH_8534 [Fusarium anthophilum]|uniref:Chromo domain-containing protein n=1 Tax=Fusarium anthophilum TaxID=48485 RepID=A0A8H5E0L2_9HYPO|nr:hypothetical protein FANTH_8534 [Fusarium anthophilum]